MVGDLVGFVCLVFAVICVFVTWCACVFSGLDTTYVLLVSDILFVVLYCLGLVSLWIG